MIQDIEIRIKASERNDVQSEKFANAIEHLSPINPAAEQTYSTTSSPPRQFKPTQSPVKQTKIDPRNSIRSKASSDPRPSDPEPSPPGTEYIRSIQPSHDHRTGFLRSQAEQHQINARGGRPRDKIGIFSLEPGDRLMRCASIVSCRTCRSAGWGPRLS